MGVEGRWGVRAILVRIGIDATAGGWNAPVDARTGRFVYVPIPEKPGTVFHRGCRRGYGEVVPALERFARDRGISLHGDLAWPRGLAHRAMHLDPDFETMTYGDVGSRRGREIRGLDAGDLLVFYAGLRPVGAPEGAGGLVYAMVGLMVVEEIVAAPGVPGVRRHENAHTRRARRGPTDIVVRARRAGSGRLERAITIGERRDGAYRVRYDVLDAWGGLGVRDGFIQRSARPPRILDVGRFGEWLGAQGAVLKASNFDGG